MLVYGIMLGAGSLPMAPLGIVVLALACVALLMVFGVRFIPNDRVGIVEKLWSLKGSVDEGHIMADSGKAGYESRLLRGGIHFWRWHFQYKVHKVPLVTVPQGKIAYVYARDGDALQPSQTLARVVECAHFQDADQFLGVSTTKKSLHRGQRGRQRSILREGVYAINLALFYVITEDRVYHLNIDGKAEIEKLLSWQKELRQVNGFNPVIIGEDMSAFDPLNPEKPMVVDSIGIVTVHDGPSLAPGEIIAPAVGNDPSEQYYHN